MLISSHRIKYVPDSSTLPPPVKRTAAGLKGQSVKTNPLSFLRKNNQRLQPAYDTTRSMPASPSLGAQASVTNKSTLTSAPAPANGKLQRLQALRTPLIHFLAARPASEKLLAQHLACKQDEILEVLAKVGKKYRLDETKWDLSDKIFKELDIYAFSYPNQEDRELAKNRAISAFDRMRVSTKDKVWDKLLPNGERGQGKILSHLNLHKGPIHRSTTPKIQIQQASNEPKPHESAGNESDQKDRLAPSDAEPVNMARSKSHDPVKRTKVSEKEAQTKRLLAKGPKKVTPNVKPKEAHPAVKKGGAQKKNVPKSSEFVNDSDEEDVFDNAAVKQSSSATKQNNQSAKKLTKTPASPHSTASTPKVNGATEGTKATELPKPSVAAQTKIVKTPAANQQSLHSKAQPAASKSTVDAKTDKKSCNPPNLPEKKPLASGASTPAAKNRLSESSPNSTAMKKSLSRQRTTSSPHKPSPLGSSPPTNASDLDDTGRSSKSSTPLTTQSRKTIATPNGVGLGINGHARNTSEHSLKRKAGDLDSDIHNHGSPLTNGVTNGYVNGHINGNMTSAKRQKVSEDSSRSESSDDIKARKIAVDKAQDFKRYYARYEKQYQEVSQMTNAAQEKIDELMKMHRRLTELKDQITRGLIGP